MVNTYLLCLLNLPLHSKVKLVLTQIPITQTLSLPIMKKALIITCLTSFVVISSFAQITVGLKAGAGLSNVQFPDPSSNKARLAYYGGLLTEISLDKKFIIQPELLYSVKGYKFSPTVYSSGGRLSLNYISVPVLAGYRPADKLKILLGPEFNFLTSAKSRFDNTDHDLTKVYKKFDFGIDAGVAYQIQKSLGIEVRYYYGLTYLLQGVVTDPFGNDIGAVKIGKNKVLQVGICYKM